MPIAIATIAPMKVRISERRLAMRDVAPCARAGLVSVLCGDPLHRESVILMPAPREGRSA
jgi:hypothetical protein